MRPKGDNSNYQHGLTSNVEGDVVLECLSGGVEVDDVHRPPSVLAVLLHHLAVR